MSPYSIAVIYQENLIMSFAMFLGAKIRRIIYIASDLFKSLRLFNNKSCTILFYLHLIDP